MTRKEDALRHLYSMPGLAHSTVTAKELKEILLSTGGQVMCNGKLWDISSIRIGPGVYRIQLSKQVAHGETRED